MDDGLVFGLGGEYHQCDVFRGQIANHAGEAVDVGVLKIPASRDDEAGGEIGISGRSDVRFSNQFLERRSRQQLAAAPSGDPLGQVVDGGVERA